MARPRRTWERLLSGSRTIAFRDFESLLGAFGFKHVRTSGSHRIYVHPQADRPLSIQPRGNEAKPYQVRQFMDMVEEFGLSLKDRS